MNKLAILSDVALINPRPNKSLSGDEVVSFLRMADIGADGTTKEGGDRLFSDVSKGYTQFEKYDVLVAKITPCFENGKIAQVLTRHLRAAGSTEFHVVRPKPGILDSRYLHHFLRCPIIRIEGERRMTGSAGQRRVPVIYLSSLRIPLPSMNEQKRIAEVLDQADTLLASRRLAISLLDELAESVFFDMFGDPGAGESRWARSTVADVADQVTDGEHLTPEREKDGIKLLSARNVKDGYIDFTNVDYVGNEEYERIRKRCNPRKGDLLISCSGTIGRVAPVETDEPLALVRSAALIKPNRSMVTTAYLATYLRTPTLKAEMLRRARSSSQANLFQGPIRALPVLVPPLNLQHDFSRHIEEMALQKSFHQAHLAGLDTLFASLQHRAFHGEL